MNRIASPPLVILAVFVAFIFISPDASAISMQIVTNTGAAWLVEDENTYDDSSPNNAPDVNFIFANQTSIKGLGIGAKIVTFDFDTSTLIHGEKQIGIEEAVRPVNNIDTDTRFAALLNIDDDVIRYPIELNKEYIWGDTTGLEDLPTEIDENNILSYGTEYSFGVSDPNPSLLWITRHSPAEESTTRGSIIYDVRFDEAVTNVDGTDFRIAGIGSTIITMSGSGESYKITAEADIDGTYNLDLKNNHGIIDTDGNGLSSVTPLHADESYTVSDKNKATKIPTTVLDNAPELLSIERYNPSEEVTSSNELTYKITFNKPVTGVDIEDFMFTQTVPNTDGFDFNLDPENAHPRQIVYYDDTFWVLDSADAKIYAYDTDGVRKYSSDVVLDALNGNPVGLEYHDGKFWVLDSADAKIYAYNINGDRSTTNDITITRNRYGGNSYSSIVYYDGTFLLNGVETKKWRTSTSDKVYYTNGTQVSGLEAKVMELPTIRDGKGLVLHDGKFWRPEPTGRYGSITTIQGFYVDGNKFLSDVINLDRDNNNIYDMTFYDNKFYVLDYSDKKVYTYNYMPFSTKYSDSSFKVPLVYGSAVTFHDGKFWMPYANQKKVFAVHENGTRSADDDFSIAISYNSRYDRSAPYLGMTFHDGKFWITESKSDKVYVYNPDGTRSIDDEFDLHALNTAPQGITHDNGKFWIIDGSKKKVFAYTTDGVISYEDEFNLDKENANPRGMEYIDNKFYVVDSTDRKIYAYGSDDGERIPAADFKLVSANSNPYGITFHDDKIWIWQNAAMYAYDYDNVSNENNYGYSSSNDFLLRQYNNPQGMVEYEHGKILVVDNKISNVKSYNVLTGTGASLKSFSIYKTGTTGIAYDGDRYFYLVNNEYDSVYKVSEGKKRYSTNTGFELTAGNNNPQGMTWHDDKLYVVDADDVKVYVYHINGTHYMDGDFDLHSNNDMPRGIEYHDEKFWVVDKDGTIYCYDNNGFFANNNRDLIYENTDPGGIVYVRGNFLIPDVDDNKVYSYHAYSEKSSYDNVSSLNIPLNVTTNNNPIAVKKIDTHFYVIQQTHGDVNNNAILKYNSAGYNYANVKELPDDSNPVGITNYSVKVGKRSYHNYMTIVTDTDNKIYSHRTPSGNWNNGVSLDPENNNPRGITYYGSKFYVIEDAPGLDKVYVYSTSGARDVEKDFDLVSNESDGITYYNGKFYVISQNDNKVYVYTSKGIRSAADDFDIDQNYSPHGITLDSNYVWSINTNELVALKKGIVSTELSPSSLQSPTFTITTSPENINIRSIPTSISGYEYVYYVTVNATSDSTYDLDLVSDHGIVDSNDRSLSNINPSIDQIYKKLSGTDTGPSLLSISKHSDLEIITLVPGEVMVNVDGNVYYVSGDLGCEKKKRGRCIDRYSYSSYSISLESPSGQKLSVISYGSFRTGYDCDSCNSRSSSIDKDLTFSNTTIHGDWKIHMTTNSDKQRVSLSSWEFTIEEVPYMQPGLTGHVSTEKTYTIYENKQAPISYKIAFSEPVTGVDKEDFVLSPDSTATADGQINKKVSKQTAILDNNLIITDNLMYNFTLSDAVGGTVRIGAIMDNNHLDHCPGIGGNIKITYPGKTYPSTIPIEDVCHDDSFNSVFINQKRTLSNTDGTYRISIAPLYEARLNGLFIEYPSNPMNVTASSLSDYIESIETDDGIEYTVTLIAPVSGTYNLDISSTNGITDFDGNQLVNLKPTGNDDTFTVDYEYNTAEFDVILIKRIDPQPGERTQIFKVIFNERVNNVDKSIFNLIGSGNAEIIDIQGSGSEYTVTLMSYSGNDFNLEVNPIMVHKITEQSDIYADLLPAIVDVRKDVVRPHLLQNITLSDSTPDKYKRGELNQWSDYCDGAQSNSTGNYAAYVTGISSSYHYCINSYWSVQNPVTDENHMISSLTISPVRTAGCYGQPRAHITFNLLEEDVASYSDVSSLSRVTTYADYYKCGQLYEFSEEKLDMINEQKLDNLGIGYLISRGENTQSATFSSIGFNIEYGQKAVPPGEPKITSSMSGNVVTFDRIAGTAGE